MRYYLIISIYYLIIMTYRILIFFITVAETGFHSIGTFVQLIKTIKQKKNLEMRLEMRHKQL